MARAKALIAIRELFTLEKNLPKEVATESGKRVRNAIALLGDALGRIEEPGAARVSIAGRSGREARRAGNGCLAGRSGHEVFADGSVERATECWAAQAFEDIETLMAALGRPAFMEPTRKLINELVSKGKPIDDVLERLIGELKRSMTIPAKPQMGTGEMASGAAARFRGRAAGSPTPTCPLALASR